MKIGIIGAGYVGLTTAVCLATLNHEIYLYDIDKIKIQKIKNLEMPFFENGLKELLQKAFELGNLQCTGEIDVMTQNVEGCFICVGTPANEKNEIDLTQLKNSIYSLSHSIKNNNKENFIVIIRSTVVPTTTRKIILPILNDVLDVKNFGLCVVPEFLREGQAITDFMNPDKIVIGSFDDRSQSFVENVFSHFKDNAEIIKTNPETAELIKYTNNAFFSMLISFSNEIANIAENISGVDSVEVLKALIADRRITTKINGKNISPELQSYLIPGCGFGGSCFPKDVKAILGYATAHQVKTPLLEAVLRINEERSEKVLRLAESILGDLRGKRIAVLGLTFKPDTDDMRSSPSLDAINLFQKKGAEIIAYDPQISKSMNKKDFRFKITKTLEECITNSDLAILFTKWKEFQSINYEFLKTHMKNPVLIDGRVFLDPDKFEKKSYFRIGYSE